MCCVPSSVNDVPGKGSFRREKHPLSIPTAVQALMHCIRLLGAGSHRKSTQQQQDVRVCGPDECPREGSVTSRMPWRYHHLLSTTAAANKFG